MHVQLYRIPSYQHLEPCSPQREPTSKESYCQIVLSMMSIYAFIIPSSKWNELWYQDQYPSTSPFVAMLRKVTNLTKELTDMVSLRNQQTFSMATNRLYDCHKNEQQ